MSDLDAEQAISEGTGCLGWPIPENATRDLLRLAELVHEWGARMNLTGHRDLLSIARLLVADAIGVLSEIESELGAPVAGRIVDLGSGAGFPGLPMAILRPEVEVHLIESREKRHYFQRAARRELGLSNAYPLHARIEDQPVTGATCVIAQAVAPIDQVVAWMRAYAGAGATLVVPGGPDLSPPSGAEDLSGRIRVYDAPVAGRRRTLWIGRTAFA